MNTSVMNTVAKLTGNLWVRIAFGVVVAALLVVAPLISSKFINYQLGLMAVFAVAILGLNIVMGYAGQVSLGQSAFLGLGAYIAAYLVTADLPIPEPLLVPVSLLLCALIPAAVGLVVALAAARLRGLALAMVTIALPIIGIPLAKRFREYTGGAQGTTVSWLRAPDWAEGILENDQWRYYVVVLIAVLMFVLARNLVRGRMGRAFRIVKENEAVAIAMGISPYRYKVMAFTIASLFGGVAGFMYLAVVQYTSPETLSFHTSINMVAAMVIGGSASILGSILGAIYYVVVPPLANEIDPSLTALVSGVILLVILFLAPGGLVSLPRRISQLTRRFRGPRAMPQNPSDEASTPVTTGPESTEKNKGKRQGQ
jgi:branched-chain amino acid transport system permease protein